MTERANWDRMDGFTRATDPGPELTEDALEHALLGVHMVRIGLACMWFRKACLEIDAMYARPRMRKEFAMLFEGDKLVGQLMIERPFDARDWLPYVERVHPDDMKTQILPPGPTDSQLVEGGFVRKQRFNLHKGRYVLEGTEL